MLEIEITMKHITLLLGLFIFLALNSCVTDPPLLMDKSPQADKVDQSQWEDYGAVYEYDELRIKTEILNPDQGWNSFFYVNRMMHILNRKGVDNGTIYIKQYSDNLIEFDIRLWDPAGRPVPLDLAAMQKKYLKTKEIVVPQVEPGCRIGINLVFREANLIYSWEHWFERSIPVLKGRFSIFYPGGVQYTCKTFGGVRPVKQQRGGAYLGYVWDHENIVPQDDIFENRWHIDREPHIIAKIRHWSYNQYHYYSPDWKGWARQYKEYLMSPSIFTSRSTIKKIASGIILNKNGSFEKADALLAYVQDKITLDRNKKPNLNAVDPNQVLRNKSGDRWDIAVVLKELLEAGGFSTHVYVTQPQNYGGFDPDFPTWRYLYVPLIAVEINGRELVAYPYSRFMGLGEYPFNYQDLKALNLEAEDVRSVPASIHTSATLVSLATLSPVDWEDSHTWRFIYGGHYATFLRSRMNERTPEKRKDYFKSLIRGYDKENRLEKADLETMNRQGDIEVALQCRNTGSKTEGPNETHYSLKPWFRKYFVDYDISRKVNYTNDRILVFEDSVLIKRDKKTRSDYHFECTNLDNQLFSTVCEEKQTSEGTLFSRKLTVKQADLTPGQMRTIQPDIVVLNRIDESYLIEKH